MEHVIDPTAAPRGFLARFNLKERIKRLPLPVQAFINFSFMQLLALSIAIPDVIPLLDEALAAWLFYQGITATAASVRERYGDRFRAWRSKRKQLANGRHGALPDLDNAEMEDLDPSLIEMTLAELEGLDPQLVQEAVAGLRRR